MPLDHPRLSHPRLAHQEKIVAETAKLPRFAMFWEQGTMKTRPTIDTAAVNFRDGTITALVVITDDGIHSNWVDEVADWMPEDISYEIMEYHAGKAGRTKHGKKIHTQVYQDQIDYVLSTRGLAIFTFSWDGALTTDLGTELLRRIFRERRVMIVADETSAVKNPESDRNELLVKVASNAKIQRILNGTPVDHSPLDVYQQMRVLDPNFWIKTLRISSFIAFKATFAVTAKVYKKDSPFHAKQDGGRIGKDFFPTIVTFKNMDLLKRTLDEVSSRVLKEDVLDLPPKVYEWEFYKPSDIEQKIYNQLKEESAAGVGEEVMRCFVCDGAGEVADDVCPKCRGTCVVSKSIMTAVMPIVKMLRYQQVLSGYVMADDEPITDLPGPKPRLDALERILKRGNGPFIIWSRFQRDVDKIGQLCHDLGLRFGNYDGRTDTDRRTWIRHAYQAGELDVFNGNPAAASKGITLTKARTMVYYNNSFRGAHREQSEDRAHRGGLDHEVTIIDIAWHGSIDHHVIRSLRKKQGFAAAVTGDQLKKWLSL